MTITITSRAHPKSCIIIFKILIVTMVNYATYEYELSAIDFDFP